MNLRLPIRFRTRALLAIILLGLCLIISLYFSPVSRTEYQASHSRVVSKKWWNNLLSWTMAQEDLTCTKISNPKPKYFVDTAEMYPALDFSVPDNGGMGFWNDVLESRYREIRKNWKDLPLEVIVVPHSHVDPGWLRTYEDYYFSYVSEILNNMVEFMNKTNDFKFIWSEISYFSKWWNNQNTNVQNTLRDLLDRRQLEFVTGGWVMTDEATTSYFAIIDQLVEGHQWLKHHVGVSPQYAWSVDIFGHSATMPYILTSAGISGMVILRAHYAWKAFLAKSRGLDFHWKQTFDSPKILTHMAPSDLYSFKHVCGPDQFVCLKYDFRSVMGEYSESTADEITNENVKLKAGYLLSQYGRYASLFPHNVLLVPLGDDFRFNVKIEWDQQHKNFQKLFKYINGNKELNAHIKFGTVTDYFDEVKNRLTNISSNLLPTLYGDFFPYADIYANNKPSYWNGFYSTRPFYKKLAQELEHWLRTSEILYTFAMGITRSNEALKKLIEDYTLIISARQKLGLFQHHDAITGTSKDFVMSDYGHKLHTAINDAMSVTAHTTQLLMIENFPPGQTWTSQVYPDVYRSGANENTKKLSIFVPDDGRKVIVFNALTFERTEVVRLKVRSSNVKVFDSFKNKVLAQVNPVWKNELTVSSIVFELAFVVKVKPLSFATYTIVKDNEEFSDQSAKAVISLFLKDDTMTTVGTSAFKFQNPTGKDIVMESTTIRAEFSSTGVLKSIYLKKLGISKSVEAELFAYIPKPYRSGAYLFYPDSDHPTSVNNLTDHYPILSLVRGPLISELNVIYQNFISFSIRVYHFENAPDGLEMNIATDISKIRDSELILRINSDLSNNGSFYTDSNGFQMLKRNYATNLPVQGNYYPATSAMYIEDIYDHFRLNILLPHSHGVTSVLSNMEIMIDRRMQTDDGRGVGEGIQDNKKISTSFWIFPEINVYKSQDLSTSVHKLSQQQKYPLVTLLTENSANLTRRELLFLKQPWPNDVHLVNMRKLSSNKNYSLPSNDSLMIIYDRLYECRSNSFMQNVVENYNALNFSSIKVKHIEETFLTGVSTPTHQDTKNSSVPKIQAFRMTLV